MPRFFYLFLLIANYSAALHAQVVRSVPVFPNGEESLTIYFNAEFGNGGLKDCNCDVYMHTGVITDRSTSPSDWKYVQGVWGQANAAWRMQRAGANLYTFTMTPRSYYNVPGNEQIKRLAFVFRNADGSKAGRAGDGSDIFLEIYASSNGLLTLLESPGGDVVINSPGQQIPVVAHSSRNAIFEIKDNGAPVYQTPDSTLTLDYDFQSNSTGLTHRVEIFVNAANERDTLVFQYFNISNSPVVNPPFDTGPGITKLSGNTYRFKLVVPGKTSVFMLNENSGWALDNQYIMNRSTSGDYFWKDINIPAGQDWFLYQYLVDGGIKIADPYAPIVLDPFNDGAISNAYFPAYPAGAQDMVTAFKVTGFNYTWTDQDFQKPKKTALNIYELLLRDFLQSHSYADLKDTLNYLKKLGINAIELMPVQEFEGNNSWGYNPSYHMALDKYYGDPVQFKDFINEAHRLDMAVILDVVFNHAFGQSPLARLYFDSQNNRPAANNPWLNPIAKHPFNVGYDFNHESSYTKEFTKKILKYWLDEFHIDGFRFDLSKGFTQNDSGSDVGAWGTYDASRIAIWKNYANAIWASSPDAILILEHFADNSEEKELAEFGFLLWGNMNGNYSDASMGYHDAGKSNLTNAVYQARNWTAPHLVAYMESHDEERMNYRNLNFGNGNGGYSTKNFDIAIERLKMCNVFYWLLPGPKMIWQFGELGYDFSINRCPNGSISNDCRLADKPIRWDYFQNPQRRSLYNHISSLIKLRDSYDLAEPDNFKRLLGGEVKKFELKKDDLTLFAIGNFDVAQRTDRLDFSSQGIWYELFTGETVDYDGSILNVDLAPGEYRLYANKKIDLLSAVRPVLQNNEVKIYPNPANEFLKIELPAGLEIQSCRILNVTGQTVSSFQKEELLNISSLQSGLYFIEIQTIRGRILKKFLKI